MRVRCIRYAAVPNLRYDLSFFYTLTDHYFYIRNVDKNDDLILRRQKLNS